MTEPINTDVVYRPVTLHLNLPADIDPAVLDVGVSVISLFDESHRELVVVRVEPALVCVDDDGQEHTVLAHEVYLKQDQPGVSVAHVPGGHVSETHVLDFPGRHVS